MLSPVHPSPTAAHILVCTGPRCSGRGARQLFHAAWQEFELQRIAYYRTGGNVRLTEAGCLGACDVGPNLAAYVRQSDGSLRDEWHCDVTVSDLVALGHRLNVEPDRGASS